MNLYHYSKQKHSVLLTLEKQGLINPEDRKRAHEQYVKECKLYKSLRPGYYYEHISVFYERPPLNKISACFDNRHKFWVKNDVVYEHVINSQDIGNFVYEIVESPDKTRLYYDSISDKEYYKKLQTCISEKQLVGRNNESLEKALGEMSGLTEIYFELIKTRSNFEELLSKYAATVPHVMLYPMLGKIIPYKINKVVLG